jgi:hypothetical protein
LYLAFGPQIHGDGPACCMYMYIFGASTLI